MNIEQKINNNTSPAIEAMQCYAQPNIQLFNCDNRILMQTLADESVDVILTDPPYLYLKNQKLERPFDEQLFFSECKRVLTKNGFIVLFGRGTSFYRWNTILADLGFKFKEEVVWDKIYNSSPVLPMSRTHETVSIFTKRKGIINKVKVPYLEMKSHDLDSIVSDIKRLKSIISNPKELQKVEDYLLTGNVYSDSIRNEESTTVSARSTKKNNISAAVMKFISEGLNEKSIIRNVHDRYTNIHPTQKPVRLLERLLSLVIPKDKEPKDIVVADFFGGSFSTMEAVYNMGMQGIACEIDKEYFDAGKERIEKLPPRQTALFD